MDALDEAILETLQRVDPFIPQRDAYRVVGWPEVSTVKGRLERLEKAGFVSRSTWRKRRDDRERFNLGGLETERRTQWSITVKGAFALEGASV